MARGKRNADGGRQLKPELASSWRRCPACLLVLPIGQGHVYDIHCWMEREGLPGASGGLYDACGRGDEQALESLETLRADDDKTTKRVRELFLQFEDGAIDREQLRRRRWRAYVAIGATDPGGKWPTAEAAEKMLAQTPSDLIGRPL